MTNLMPLVGAARFSGSNFLRPSYAPAALQDGSTSARATSAAAPASVATAPAPAPSTSQPATPVDFGADPDAVAFEVRDGGNVVYEQHGGAVSKRDDGHGLKHPNVRRRFRNFFRKVLVPTNYPAAVSADYMPFRRWVALQNFASSGVDFFATQGILAGLGVQLSSPLVGTISYLAKDGLNEVGKLIGGTLAKRADVDPKTWYARCETIQAIGSATQSTLLVAPQLFLLTAPITNGAKAFASAINGAATANIENHQSMGQSVGDLKAKNNNQNTLSGIVGSGLAVGLSIAGRHLFGPAASLVLAVGFGGLQIFAARKAAGVLQMNDVTDTRLRRLVRAQVQGSATLAPSAVDDNKYKVPRSHPDPELGVGLGDMVKDGARFDRLRALYGSDRYLLDFDGKKIRVALDPNSTPEDQARAVYQSQLLAELVDSPGFARIGAGLSEREAQLKAIELSYAATPASLSPMLAEMRDLGWATGRIVLGADNVRVRWKAAAAAAPPATLTLDQFRALLK